MVVDPGDFGVSESRDGSVDDALNAESGGSGFVWAADDPETARITTSQNNDRHTSAEQPTSATPSDPFEWAGTVTEDAHHPIHDGPDTSQNSQSTATIRDTDESRGQENATDDDGAIAPGMNGDSSGSVVSTVATPATDDSESPERVALDPIDYPVDELRTIADCETVSLDEETEVHGFVWSEPPEQYRAHIEDPTPQQRQRLLTIAGIDPEQVGEKPYLVRVSTDEVGAFITDWLEFLTDEAGTEGAIEALEHYEEIGWMTEHVAEEFKNELRSLEHHGGDGFETFDRGDHLLNFAYVAKITSLSSEGMVFY